MLSQVKIRQLPEYDGDPSLLQKDDFETDIEDPTDTKYLIEELAGKVIEIAVLTQTPPYGKLSVVGGSKVAAVESDITFLTNRVTLGRNNEGSEVARFEVDGACFYGNKKIERVPLDDPRVDNAVNKLLEIVTVEGEVSVVYQVPVRQINVDEHTVFA